MILFMNIIVNKYFFFKNKKNNITDFNKSNAD